MASQWLGALPPPPGVTPDFVDPPTQRDGNIALHTVLLSLVTILVVLRLYTRVWVTKVPLGIEDYLCVVFYLLSVTFSGLVIKAYTRGIGRHIWDTPAPWLPEALMYFTISTWVYLILAATVKLTFLSFYHRLFSTHTYWRYFGTGAIIFVALLNVSLIFATVFSCTPVSREWDPTIPGHCVDPVILPYFSGISSFLTDLYVLILPIALLWQLNMTTQQKIKASCVFGLGILACVASLIRLIQTPSLRTSYDATWTISNIIIWASLEVNVGIICSCLVVLPAFLDRHLPSSTRMFSRLFSSGSSRQLVNNADHLSSSGSASGPGYKQPGDTASQSLVLEKGQQQNNILQTNTFSMSEAHDQASFSPSFLAPWEGRTDENELRSTYVGSEANFA
ncbi:hypothetical protein GGS24DRAFT_513468 [Hypoxylon argillaceum]|nr:hypothetical protein GGS24DRAFT_513468 [Hypoxylon argillaceum]